MTAPAAAVTARAKYIALIAMLFAVAMTFIDQTIVAIASPNIQSELDFALRHPGGRPAVEASPVAVDATA